MNDARSTAAKALVRMDAAGAYSNLVIDSMIRQNQLSPRDSAFAAALFYGTLERLITIDHILTNYSARPLKDLSQPVLQTLRLGVCQLVYLGGVDEYAAVSESVNLVKNLGCPQASGFVNGVLRSFLRDDKAVPIVKGDRAAQLSIEYSCPKWLVERWLSAYGEPAALRMLAGSLGKPPVYLRANTLQIQAVSLCNRLGEEGIDCLPDAPPTGCILVRGRMNAEELPAFNEGLFHVQDKASQICAEALGALPGERVLDTCAAPGGKTFTIAQYMENRGEIVARDLHLKRAELVSKGAARLGITIVKASAGDAGIFDPELGKFDRVLCDAPCSGFGVIRRKPEIKYKPQASVENLPAIQYKILQNSSKYLKSGGTLVYSTCTLLPEENERVVERFLAQTADFFLVSQKTYTGENADTDGFYISVLQKR